MAMAMAMAEGGYIDVKCRINGVVEKMKDCSGELHEIERRIMADGCVEERAGLLSTVREMLGALETGLKRVSENEESESRSKRMRSEPGICTHTCVHHAEIVNPGLWSKLPEDLVGLVFARLPIPRIIELRKSSTPWAAMSESASFKGAFAEVNPKLFGLLGWDRDVENFCTRMLDAASSEWHTIKLDFPRGEEYMDSFPLGKYGYRDAMYACDGGLVCFVPQWDYEKHSDCIFVCNPLTDEWRKLPNLWDVFGFRFTIMVQLVTDELFYQVKLVYVEKRKKWKRQDIPVWGAFVYDSRARSWSVMTSGLVYGFSGNSLLDVSNDPLIFDCATKQLIHLNRCAAVEDLQWLRASILKDRLFVLHARIDPDSFVISELTWDSSLSDLRKLSDYEVDLRDLDSGSYGEGNDVEIFASNGLILSTWDIRPEYKSARQLIRIYDVFANRWYDLPPLGGQLGLENENLLDGLFMSELRWDAEP